jgi:hypothetical protein
VLVLGGVIYRSGDRPRQAYLRYGAIIGFEIKLEINCGSSYIYIWVLENGERRVAL